MYLKNLLIVFVAMVIAAAFMATPAIAGECYQQKMERLRQWEGALEKYNADLDQEYRSLSKWSHTESERARQISEDLRHAKEEIRILKAEIADLEADNQRLGQQQCAAPDPDQFWREPEVPATVPQYDSSYDRVNSWNGQSPAYSEPIPQPFIAVVPLDQYGENNITVINQFDRDRREKRWDRSDSQFQHRSDFHREDRRDHAIRGDDSSTRRRDLVHPGNTSMHNDRVRRGNLSPGIQQQGSQQRPMPARLTQPEFKPHFGSEPKTPPHASGEKPQRQVQRAPQARMAPRPQPMSASRIQQPQVRQIQPQQNTPQNNGAIRGGRR